MEEKLNAVTHGAGAVLAGVGLVFLLWLAYQYGTVWHVISFAVYGSTLFLMYLMSTLYHSFRKEKLKNLFKIFDHSSIYLLIAGTYTPFALIVLHGWLGWTVFGVIWGLALIGVVLSIFFVHRFRKLSTLCYVLMGWLIVFCIQPLMERFDGAGMMLLALGGAFYSIGAIFYLVKKLPYNHVIWHLFVLAGSAFHFVAIVRYVLPMSV